MSQDQEEVLKVIGTSHDGRRHYYSREGKRRLVEACLQPGASLAGLARKHGVNANQLRKWVKLHQEKHNVAPGQVIEGAAPAFVPVVEIARADKQQAEQLLLPPSRNEPTRVPRHPPAASLLTVEMPNGVTLRLECSGQDATLVSAMIETLGRCDVPAGR